MCWFWSIQIFGTTPPSATIFSEPPLRVSKNFRSPPSISSSPPCHIKWTFPYCYFYNSEVACTCLVRKVWYFMAYFRAPSKIWLSPTVARIYSRHPVMCSQDQVCDNNHAECVLFSESLIPRRNTKPYFLQHNAGCYQIYNNPQFPVRSQSMEVTIMRSQWSTGWLES